MSDIRFQHFPITHKPPQFVEDVVDCFRKNESAISTVQGMSGNSDAVLQLIRTDLEAIGFDVEKSKKRTDKIFRPITFGVNGIPQLKYEIDAYNSVTRVGLEIEAGRGVKGNAIYRDLILGMMMTNVDHLVIAVANEYRYKSNNKQMVSKDFVKCVDICNALSGHTRVQLPYTITIIGY